MTTLMKAPDIFAFIATLLLVLLMIIWGISTFWMAYLLRKNVVIKQETITTNKQKGKKKKS
jgi:hypothetical protein